MNFVSAISKRLLYPEAVFCAAVLLFAEITPADIRLFGVMAAFGLVGGLGRLLRSKTQWKPRSIATFSLLGCGFGFAIPAIYYADALQANQFKATGVAFLIGFGQVEIAELIPDAMVAKIKSKFSKEGKE